MCFWQKMTIGNNAATGRNLQELPQMFALISLSSTCITKYTKQNKKSELHFLYTAAQSRHTFTFPIFYPAVIDYVQESLDLTFVERDTSDGLGGTSGLRCLEREPYELRLG